MGNRRHCNDNSEGTNILGQNSTIDATLTADVDDLKDPMDNTYDSVRDSCEDSECRALLGDNSKYSLNTTNRLRSVSCSTECRESPDVV